MSHSVSFHFTRDVIAAVTEHVVQEYPSEACGWIIQSCTEELRYHPADNLQDKYHKVDPETFPRTSKDAFLMDALNLTRNIEQAEKQGGNLYCIVHSHIEVGAYFSEEDIKQMTEPSQEKTIYPAQCYLVANVNQHKQVDEYALFYFTNEKKTFLQAEIKII